MLFYNMTDWLDINEKDICINNDSKTQNGSPIVLYIVKYFFVQSGTRLKLAELIFLQPFNGPIGSSSSTS